MNKYTLIGGNGFIGSEVAKLFRGQGYEVFIPIKNDPRVFNDDLGVVIYCAGYGDCINNHTKVYESNTKYLSEIINKAKFSRLVYISSTRVYMGIESNAAYENSDVIIKVKDNRRLFNLSKLLSEELCLLSDKDIIIVRPSNVYGVALNSPLFLPAITRNAIKHGVVDMHVTPGYAKDYVSVYDVADAVCRIAKKENLSSKIYNIASGENISASQIAKILESETQCDVIWHDVETEEVFPKNDISMLIREIDYKPRKVLEDLSRMIVEYKKELKI